MKKLSIFALGLALLAAGCGKKDSSSNLQPEPETNIQGQTQATGTLKTTVQKDPSKPAFCPTKEELDSIEAGLKAGIDNPTVITAIMEFTKVQNSKEFLAQKLPAGTKDVNFQAINTPGGGGSVVVSETTFQQMLDRYNKAASFNNPNPPKYGVISVKVEATTKQILAVKESLPKSYFMQVVRPQDMEKEKALRATGGKTVYPLGLVIDCGIE